MPTDLGLRRFRALFDHHEKPPKEQAGPAHRRGRGPGSLPLASWILYVVSSDGGVAHQTNDDDRQHHGGGPVTVVGPTKGVGLAEVISERGAQGTREHVGHPEGGDLIETGELPEESRQRYERRESRSEEQ